MMDPMPEVVPEASPDQEVEYLFCTLFENVDLDGEQRDAAKRIIRRDVDGRRVRHRGPELAWRRDVALIEQRDDALRAILQDTVQQAAFEKNAAELQRMLDDLRLDAGT